MLTIAARSEKRLPVSPDTEADLPPHVRQALQTVERDRAYGRFRLDLIQ